MKSITEFPVHKLSQAFTKRAELTAAGKTPEEIQTEMGTAFKMEGDKLKHFLAAIDVAQENLQNLARIMVVQFSEGESASPKAKKIEDFHYLPEFTKDPKAPVLNAEVIRGGQGKRGDKKGGQKDSPYGMSTDQKAEKKAQQKAAAAAKA